MQFRFTEEQNLIRETVDQACAKLCDLTALSKTVHEGDGFHREAWHSLTGEMGLGMTSTPENLGGAGLGIVELASILEVTGRYLVPTPFLTSIVMSAGALSRSEASDTIVEILPQLISGEKVASFVHIDASGVSTLSSSAPSIDAQNRISGDASCVQYGQFADYFVVLAASADGPAMAIIDAQDDSIRIQAQTSMDLTRPLSAVAFKDTPILGGMPVTKDRKVIENCLDIARICLASEQLGASESVLTQTRAYGLERKQFGRQIGSFQAVKHRLADMMVLNEAAKSAVWYAACAADELPEEIPVAAATAMIVATRALSRSAGHMIQLHGGMGFTWECQAHHYFKRAALSAKLLGAPETHRELLASIALEEAP